MKLLAKARDVRATARDEPDFSTLLEEVELSVESHDDDDSIELDEEAQPLGVVEAAVDVYARLEISQLRDSVFSSRGVGATFRTQLLQHVNEKPSRGDHWKSGNQPRFERVWKSVAMSDVMSTPVSTPFELKRHFQKMKATMKRATKRFHTTMNPPCGGGFDAGFLVSGGERHMGNLLGVTVGELQFRTAVNS